MPAVVFAEVSLCKWYKAGGKSSWSSGLKIWLPGGGAGGSEWVSTFTDFLLFVFVLIRFC